MLLKTTMLTNTYHGWGALDSLPQLVEPFHVKTILLIIDPFLKNNDLFEKLMLLLAPYEVVIFDQITTEPTLEQAESLVKFAKNSNCDLVVGLGGGSVLDVAKLVAVLVTHEGNVVEYLNLSGHKKLKDKGIPKIIIPTTSGTGSEVTNISVLSLEGSKDVVSHDYLLADIAILDPKLTVTVPPKVTAATGIDALTHAIESYLSVNSNPITEGLALHAIFLITRSLSDVVFNGSNKAARIDLSYGSYLAGLSFFNAGVGGVHALAYPLGGQYGISHGESNALLLPYVLNYIRSSCIDKLRDIYVAMGFEIGSNDNEQVSKWCIKAIEDLITDIGIPNTLQAFDIPESGLVKLAEDAIKQTRLLARSPMELSFEDILNIYQNAWKGM
ncbi:iron-containing alcohol dehydrogenase [Ignatzschineria rhizosphaerae]|uniref:Iron-containing alcohol dehydrogenase n=1 Tax=Ignatzschineria rhizosphaerae TaxID=2923279 RepID=A0ABY3X258_9GAMM|nr:iron-containing alcohol dehydrogenase [Ignatzschineria rhizosphaerae]UNM96914.1 iron-containing alcohol dehydrogenase [Ignatzschineria rhizosphaerae]